VPLLVLPELPDLGHVAPGATGKAHEAAVAVLHIQVLLAVRVVEGDRRPAVPTRWQQYEGSTKPGRLRSGPRLPRECRWTYACYVRLSLWPSSRSICPDQGPCSMRVNRSWETLSNASAIAEHVVRLVKYSKAMRYIQSGSGRESHLPRKILCLSFCGFPRLRNFCQLTISPSHCTSSSGV
jgi:hypothetical protein